MAKGKREVFPFILIVPALITLIFIIVYPMVYSLYTSLTNYNMATGVQNFIGLANYLKILSDEAFWESLKITIIFAAGTLTLSCLIGLGLALILNTCTRGRSIFLPILLSPMMLSPVVIGLMWGMMYNADYGIYTFLLSLIGIKRRSWIGDPSTALLSVTITDVWQWTPFVMILLLSRLQTLPVEPYEAAQLDGANRWQILRHITLPLIMPTLLATLIFRMLDAFRVFDVVWTLTAGGPATSTEVMSLYIYRSGFRFFNMGYAMALSWVMLIITVLISQLYIKQYTKSLRR